MHMLDPRHGDGILLPAWLWTTPGQGEVDVSYLSLILSFVNYLSTWISILFLPGTDVPEAVAYAISLSCLFLADFLSIPTILSIALNYAVLSDVVLEAVVVILDCPNRAAVVNPHLL